MYKLGECKRDRPKHLRSDSALAGGMIGDLIGVSVNIRLRSLYIGLVQFATLGTKARRVLIPSGAQRDEPHIQSTDPAVTVGLHMYKVV